MKTIYTASPNQLKKDLEFVRDENTLVLLITQYGFDFDDAKRYRSLAPSKALFNKAQNYKKEYPENWFEYYAADFNKELDEKDQVFKNIDDFMEDENHNLILVCYCKDYNICHRSLVAKKFRERGYNVEEFEKRIEVN